MKRTFSISREVPMYPKKFLTPVMGVVMADVVSAAKIRFAPGRVNHSKNPQI